MTFTDQNFTRLPLVNIRRSVLSVGPICHLSWAPELEKLAEGNNVLPRKWHTSIAEVCSVGERAFRRFHSFNYKGLTELCHI